MLFIGHAVSKITVKKHPNLFARVCVHWNSEALIYIYTVYIFCILFPEGK